MHNHLTCYTTLLHPSMVPGNLPSQLEILSSGQTYYHTQSCSTVICIKHIRSWCHVAGNAESLTKYQVLFDKTLEHDVNGSIVLSILELDGQQDTQNTSNLKASPCNVALCKLKQYSRLCKQTCNLTMHLLAVIDWQTYNHYPRP